MSDYPKKLWMNNGEEVTVHADSDVQKLIEDGVYALPVDDSPAPAEPVVAPVEDVAPEPDPEPETPEGPTFGPPDDDTYAKRKSTHKKK